MADAREHTKVTINRAPVLTLWAAVVAERLGYDRAAALTLGRSVAGVSARFKGGTLGLFEPPTPDEAARRRREAKREKAVEIELLGRVVRAKRTPEGLRAMERGRPANPEAVERYLESKFGDALPAARAAMKSLASAFPPAELEKRAFGLYEQFRPSIPAGVRGWGAAGELDLALVRALAKPHAASRPQGARLASASARGSSASRSKRRG